MRNVIGGWLLAGIVASGTAAAESAEAATVRVVEDFASYASTAELSARWTPFDAGNPAPERLTRETGEAAPFMRLENGAAQTYSVLVRRIEVPEPLDGGVLRIRWRGASGNAAGLTAKLGVRPDRNVPDAASAELPAPGAEWTWASLPLDRLAGRKAFFLLLSVLNPTGRAARLDVARVELVADDIAAIPVALPGPGGKARLEDFDRYDDDDALRRVWTPFDADNPAPDAWTLEADSGGGRFLRMENAAERGYSVLIRPARLPGDFRPAQLGFRVRGAAGNDRPVTLRVAVRAARNAPDLAHREVAVVGTEWRRVEIPAEGLGGLPRFHLLVSLIHEPGGAVRVDLDDFELAPAPAFADAPERKAARRARLLSGRMVQFDTEFAYYKNRSAASIADELRLNGFDSAFYIVMRTEQLRREVAAAVQEAGLGLGLMIGPAMINLSEAELDALLPARWRDWRMEFTIPGGMDPYIFIGMVHPEYNAWFKPFIARIARDLNLDGFTFAEVHYPNYDGPSRDPVLFADVSPNYQKAFMRDTGETAFPDFADPASPRYFKTDTRLYERLLAYRVENCNAFYDDIVNGPGGLRERFPGIVFATWTLGTSEPDGIRKIRDWEGNDPVSMIRRVKPDIHFIQTHAPDWLNPEFDGSYVDLYHPFFDQIRATDPAVRLGFQADFGSRPVMRRPLGWVERFYQATRRRGVDVTTYYEFCLRWEVYNTAPELIEATRIGPRRARLAFDQRLGPDSARRMIGRIVEAEGGELRVTWGLEDGHWLLVEFDRDIPPGATRLRVPVGGLGDDPAARLALSNVEPLPYGPVNRVPENTFRIAPLS